MIALLMLAIASAGGIASTSSLCLPARPTSSIPPASRIEAHKMLREAIGEPMPQAPTMVMLHGKGGHLATSEYSIIVVRGGDGTWHGTAVGRSQIWIKDAPYSPMKRAEWELDQVAARQLDKAISHRCPSVRKTVNGQGTSQPPAPQLDYMTESIDVIRHGRSLPAFYAYEGDGAIAALIRPKQ